MQSDIKHDWSGVLSALILARQWNLQPLQLSPNLVSGTLLFKDDSSVTGFIYSEIRCQK
jgi:hypothetical protein